jgi:hypothetical protein
MATKVANRHLCLNVALALVPTFLFWAPDAFLSATFKGSLGMTSAGNYLVPSELVGLWLGYMFVLILNSRLRVATHLSIALSTLVLIWLAGPVAIYICSYLRSTPRPDINLWSNLLWSLVGAIMPNLTLYAAVWDGSYCGLIVGTGSLLILHGLLESQQVVPGAGLLKILLKPVRRQRPQ